MQNAIKPMTIQPLHLLLAMLFWSSVVVAQGDSWSAIEQTEFYSPNRTHMLKIEPHRNWPEKPGHCRATLYRGKTEVWSRHLINNHAPVQVFVADSGNYIVTMDEWHHVGELPVVIYGHRGELIRVHSTGSLGLADDVLHIKMTTSSYWWNEKSISFFGPKEQKFFIRLHWGKWIVLDLRRGDLFRKKEMFFRDDLRKEHENEWNTLVEFRKQTLAKHAMQMLGSEQPDTRETAAIMCGQEELTDAIPMLRTLLADNTVVFQSDTKRWTKVYYVRKAAKEALIAMGQNVDGVVTQRPEGD